MISPNSSYLGSAEPSWATAVPEPQLRGLLTLASLMSERVYLSDVHLGDNENFVTSYLRDRPLGLYAQLRALIQSGVVKLLLRNASVRPSVDSALEVNSFLDVYHNWLAQDQDSSWILPPQGDERIRFLTDLDSWVPGTAIARYDYLQTKSIFIDGVREAASLPAARSWLGFDNSEESRRLRARYDALLARDWFSLSDFYSLFQDAGFKASSPPMLLHGLLNEVAYSRTAGSSLVGTDLHDVPLENVFWPDAEHSSGNPLPHARTPVDAILEHAIKVLDAPDLSVVALLSADEVMELRESAGQSYFDLLNLALDSAYLAAQTNFEKRLADAAADYWQGVSEHLALRHPGATHGPRRLALIQGRLPEGLGQDGRKLFSFAVNVGVPAATVAGGSEADAIGGLAQSFEGLDLRYLFIPETQELDRIRKVLPSRTWLTRPQATVLPRADD